MQSKRMISQLRAASELLQPYYADPRIRICLAQLEGMAMGWFHLSQDDNDYLIDLLDDLRLEAMGTPLEDHWRGHPLTVAEAGGWVA